MIFQKPLYFVLEVVDLKGELYTYALFGDTASMVLINRAIALFQFSTYMLKYMLKLETSDQRQLSFKLIISSIQHGLLIEREYIKSHVIISCTQIL